MDGSVLHISSPTPAFPPELRLVKKPPEAHKHKIESTVPFFNKTLEEIGALSEKVDFANTIAEFFNQKISFSYDKRINQVIVKVMRGDTDEVIRQIPPQEMVELMAKLREDFRGLILNHKG